MQKEFIEWRKSNVSSILLLHGIRKLYLDLLRDGMTETYAAQERVNSCTFLFRPFRQLSG
jgi:hypothetical protein